MPLYGDGNKQKHEFKYINESLPRVDARDKVTGRARYAADLVFHNMLVAGTLHSPCAHAQVTRISVEKARAIPGVAAVLTFQDLKKEKSWGYYTFLSSRLRYQGDAVAIVAAEDRRALRAALAAIEVEYEELPAVRVPGRRGQDAAAYRPVGNHSDRHAAYLRRILVSGEARRR